MLLANMEIMFNNRYCMIKVNVYSRKLVLLKIHYCQNVCVNDVNHSYVF